VLSRLWWEWSASPPLAKASKNRVPDAPLAPAAKALETLFHLPNSSGRSRHGRTGAQHPQHAVHERPVIARCRPTPPRFARKKRYDDLAHASSLSPPRINPALPSRGSLIKIRVTRSIRICQHGLVPAHTMFRFLKTPATGAYEYYGTTSKSRAAAGLARPRHPQDRRLPRYRERANR